MIATLALFFQLAAPTIVDAPIQKVCEVRDTTVNYVVVHYDNALTYHTTRRTLLRRRLSYNYYIYRTGVVVRMMKPECKADHAGLSYYDGHFMMNAYSIGVVLQNKPPQTYTKQQYRSLAWLILTLEKRWPDMRDKKPVGHGDVAMPVNRKDDPGPQFRWIYLDSLLTRYRTP